MSEADVGDMAVEAEPSRQYSVKFCCRATDDGRGAVRHGSAYEAKVCNWIPPCRKKLHPMTFINASWTFTETKQWTLTQWRGGWHVSAVATATWKMSQIPDGHAQLSHLAPSDSRLFGLMKDGLHGQHFPSYDAVVQAVEQWATSAIADLYERGMQPLVHRWRKCIASGGDCAKK